MFAHHAYSEKRDLIRMDMSCDISVSTFNRQFTANCNDLSGNGIRFSAAEAMSVGDVVDIDIYPKNAITSPLFATAEVIWVEPEKTDQFMVGAQIKIKN